MSWQGIDEAQWAAAVAYLRRRMLARDRTQIAAEIGKVGLERWIYQHHIPFGMWVRNTLRRKGFDEGKLRVLDLDAAWGYLLEDALKPLRK
ncbi:MAG: hypothetical protein ACRENB_07065 [Gemmatimonadales bacterium]